MKTNAPRTFRPFVSMTLMLTVMGLVRLVTGFGANRTWETTRRSPVAFRLSTGTEFPAGGGVFARTWSVGFEIADFVPASFRAVTRTRNVRPTSLSTTTYWLSVAPLISPQLLPLELQRSH